MWPDTARTYSTLQGRFSSNGLESPFVIGSHVLSSWSGLRSTRIIVRCVYPCSVAQVVIGLNTISSGLSSGACRHTSNHSRDDVTATSYGGVVAQIGPTLPSITIYRIIDAPDELDTMVNGCYDPAINALFMNCGSGKYTRRLFSLTMVKSADTLTAISARLQRIPCSGNISANHSKNLVTLRRCNSALF